MGAFEDRARRWALLLGYSAGDGKALREAEKRESLYRRYLEEAEKEEMRETRALIRKDMNRTKIEDKKHGVPEDFLERKIKNVTARKTVERVLLVYAVTNKTVGYVQGMNFLCSLLYYVLSQGVGEAHSESVCYFCFFYLMVDLGDLFSEKMDRSACGVLGQQERALAVLRKNDPLLFKSVAALELFETSSFFLRWTFLMFSGEFCLCDTLALWDRFFEESPKHKMLPYFSTAVLICERKTVIGNQAHRVLADLQKIKTTPKKILAKAEKLMKREYK